MTRDDAERLLDRLRREVPPEWCAGLVDREAFEGDLPDYAVHLGAPIRRQWGTELDPFLGVDFHGTLLARRGRQGNQVLSDERGPITTPERDDEAIVAAVRRWVAA